MALVLLALAGLFEASSACMAAGICGATGGCGGYGAPPPPMPCNPGCGPGYGCGSYGCYRLAAKMHSSKTLRLPQQSDPLSMSPDEKFASCCRDRQLPDACMTKCAYGRYTKEAVRAMYFKMDQCPSQAAADIHFCAAQGRDHRQCCRENAVATTLAGNKCLAFCDQTPGKVTQLDLTYLACYHRFDQMMRCFYDDVANGEGSRLPAASVPVAGQEDEKPAPLDEYDSIRAYFQEEAEPEQHEAASFPAHANRAAKTFRQH